VSFASARSASARSFCFRRSAAGSIPFATWPRRDLAAARACSMVMEPHTPIGSRRSIVAARRQNATVSPAAPFKSQPSKFVAGKPDGQCYRRHDKREQEPIAFHVTTIGRPGPLTVLPRSQRGGDCGVPQREEKGSGGVGRRGAYPRALKRASGRPCQTSGRSTFFCPVCQR
jgi:hypothetical protein